MAINYITGTPANEVIYGSGGNNYDYIDGKGGSDQVINYNYHDHETYVFNYGYGQPNITTESGPNDTVLFGPGIKASDLQFFMTSTGYLMARIKDTRDKVEITNWPNPQFQVATWKFNDGTVLTNTQINSLIDYNTKVVIATPNNDIVKINKGSNYVFLMQGNDIFTASGGYNIVDPSNGSKLVYNYGSGALNVVFGKGSQYVEDHGTNGRYVYSQGNGQDTVYDFNGANSILKFGMGITADNLIFSTDVNNLVVGFKNSSTDKLIIKNWLLNPSFQIGTFELWDGTQFTSQSVNLNMATQQGSSQGSIAADPLFITPTATIIGTDFYNYISSGNSGDSIYYLKKGNDRVMDYTGNDTYLFNKADGQDNITDQEGNDAIVFGAGISKSDVSFKIDPANSLNLIISLNNSNDSINVNKWFKNSAYQIEKVLFSDGSGFTNADINNIINNSGNSSSSLQPVQPANIIISDGTQTVTGTNVDSSYTFGKGNDTINGGNGNDTYIFNKGNGQAAITDIGGDDTIKFGMGISQKDVSFSKNANDMMLNIAGSNDQLTIKNWYANTSNYFQNKIEHFSFADGSSLNPLDVEQKVMNNWAAFGYTPTVVGIPNKYNYFAGYSGDNIYDLQGQGDRVMAYSGNNTYLYNQGEGTVNITDQGGNATLVFGLGLTKNDITFGQNGLDLIMYVQGRSNSVDINKWFKSSVYQIKNVKFLDGTYYTNNDINQIIQQMAAYSAGSDTQIPSTDPSASNQQNITLVPV